MPIGSAEHMRAFLVGAHIGLEHLVSLFGGSDIMPNAVSICIHMQIASFKIVPYVRVPLLLSRHLELIG
jgi:hypothetical protein